MISLAFLTPQIAHAWRLRTRSPALRSPTGKAFFLRRLLRRRRYEPEIDINAVCIIASSSIHTCSAHTRLLRGKIINAEGQPISLAAGPEDENNSGQCFIGALQLKWLGGRLACGFFGF